MVSTRLKTLRAVAERLITARRASRCISVISIGLSAAPVRSFRRPGASPHQRRYALLRRLFFCAVFEARVFLAERQSDLSGRTVSLFCDDEFSFSSTPLLFLFIGRVVFRTYQ